MQRLLTLLILATMTSPVLARNFRKIKIPGAVCGSGLPYSVFVDVKPNKKLALEFMGGGACWSTSTCYGKKIRAWMFPVPKSPYYSAFTLEDPQISPVWDHSLVYFPYCTGDVFVGNHKATYKWRLKAHHKGKKNIELALEYLHSQGIIEFDQLEELFVYGLSAGAIGAMANLHDIEKYIPTETKRTLIADSPGMHFGEKFWQKFPKQWFLDAQKAFANIGLDIFINQGMVAPLFKKFCYDHPQWSVGVIQSSRDYIMSGVFGDISKDDHEELVFGPKGIIKTVEGIPNCSAWVSRLSRHTYLLTPWISRLMIQGQNPISYSFAVRERLMLPNFVDYEGQYLDQTLNLPTDYVTQSWHP